MMHGERESGFTNCELDLLGIYGVSWSFCYMMIYVGIIKSLIDKVCEPVALEWCLAAIEPHSRV
jgi:hypothetical protein